MIWDEQLHLVRDVEIEPPEDQFLQQMLPGTGGFPSTKDSVRHMFTHFPKCPDFFQTFPILFVSSLVVAGYRSLLNTSAPDGSLAQKNVTSAARRKVATDLAVEGYVLLKNDDTLPLPLDHDKDKKKIVNAQRDTIQHAEKI